jgi:outer membrane protein assembly factor BamE
MTKTRTLLCITAALMVSACAVERLPGVYRIDIQQGNVVTHEMLDQLEPGMSRKQVRFVMGTPMIVDSFRDDRWDYYFSFRPGNGDLETQHVRLIFEGDRLARVDGSLPPRPEGDAYTGGSRTVAVTGQLPDSRGMLDKVWDSLTDWDFSDDEPPAATATESSTADAAASGEAAAESAGTEGGVSVDAAPTGTDSAN